MPVSIYDTYFMLAAIEEMPLEHTFFKDRYFPTDETMDIFGTSRVLADYKNTKHKRAPFVLPRIGAIPVGRDGYSTFDLEPANISISMPLTYDQLTHRGFGESLLSQKTPADRARLFLMNDLDDLSKMISRTEELLAVQTMIDNGCTMRHVTDNPDIYKDVKVQFYDGDSNPALYTPSAAWTHSTKSGETWTRGTWYSDISAMIKRQVSKGRPVTEIVISSDVSEFLTNDGWFLEMLDNHRVEIGRVEPTALTPDVTNLGVVNFDGRKVDVLVHDGTYEDENGDDVPYLPDETVIATAPNCGRGLYGAVSQIENREWVTIAGRRVPQHIVTEQPPMIETKVSCRPLFVPNRPNPWCVAKNVLTEE